MFDQAALDQIVLDASRLTRTQLATLGRAANPWGKGRLLLYLGLTRSFMPFRFAEEAVFAAGREQEMTSESTRLADALLKAAIEVAGQTGRDTGEVWAAWERFKSLHDLGDLQGDEKQFQATRRVVRQGLAIVWRKTGLRRTWSLDGLLSRC